MEGEVLFVVRFVEALSHSRPLALFLVCVTRHVASIPTCFHDTCTTLAFGLLYGRCVRFFLHLWREPHYGLPEMISRQSDPEIQKLCSVTHHHKHICLESDSHYMCIHKDP